MSISTGLRSALGDHSSYVTKYSNDSSSGSTIDTTVANYKDRLSSVGVDTEAHKKTNFLIKALDILSRPGYAANNMLDELVSHGYNKNNAIEDTGSTPDKFDPLAAWLRGLKAEETPSGRDIVDKITAANENSYKSIKTKPVVETPDWLKKTQRNVTGLAVDLFNPLDVTNYIGIGQGSDVVKGASKGAEALKEAFGATKASRIAEIVNDVEKASRASDVVKGMNEGLELATDAGKVVKESSKATKSVDELGSLLKSLGASNVGDLVGQVNKVTKGASDAQLDELSTLIRDGLLETGKDASSKLDYKAMRRTAIGLQNPFSIGTTGTSVKLPGYTASGGKLKLPIVFPGADIKGTFVDLPGSEYVNYAIKSITDKVMATKVGQAVGKAFSTAFVPNTVPNQVIKRDIAVSNLDDLMSIAKTRPNEVPLTVEELMNLQDELKGINVTNKFDYSPDFTAGELKAVNKGEYLSIDELARSVGLKGISTDDLVKVLSDTPFSKNITELYDSLRVAMPTADSKTLFIAAAKLRKIMDMTYDQIPEALKPFFKGILGNQMSDLYPTDITTHRLGKNLSTSPLLSYVFDYKGVPVSLVVNAGENFNVNGWNKLSSAFEALDELPEEALQALKGQIDISPIPIKSPDTSMTIGDTIVLGRIDKPTVAHEYGHVWDSVAGDPDKYSQAILKDSSKVDTGIDTSDLYSDYSRSLYDTDKTLGLKEDLADSMSDYLKDRKAFAAQYPGRAEELDRMLKDSSISGEDLGRMVAEQQKRADMVANVPRAEEQIKSMIDSVDQYAHKIAYEPGTKVYKAFRENLASLFEQTNWKTKNWQEQVGTLFHGLNEDERKQIMDIAAQISGPNIPGSKITQPAYAPYNLYHVTKPGKGNTIVDRGFKKGSFFGTSLSDSNLWAIDRWLDEEDSIDIVRAVVDTEGHRVIDLDKEEDWAKVLSSIDKTKNAKTLSNIEEGFAPRSSIIKGNTRNLSRLGDIFVGSATSDEVGETLQEAIILNKGVIKKVEKLPEGTMDYFNSDEAGKIWEDAKNKFGDTDSPEFTDYVRKQVEKDLTDKLGIENYNSNNPLFAKQDFPVFASKLQEVTNKMPNSMSVDQFRSYLNSQGVKKEELKWTFMDDFLDGKDKVSKADVQQWVAGNKLEVQEVWKTTEPPISKKATELLTSHGYTNATFLDHVDEIIDSGGNNGRAEGEIAKEFGISEEEAFDLIAYVDGDYGETGQIATGQTQFEKYTQPGGEGYTELVFTLPSDYNRVKDPNKTHEIMNNFTGEMKEGTLEELNDFLHSNNIPLTEEEKLQYYWINNDKKWSEPTPIRSSDMPSFSATYHWNENNPVAHTRFDTRYTGDGKKVLFIDEIQSDWHQHGRDEGYLESKPSVPKPTQGDLDRYEELRQAGAVRGWTQADLDELNELDRRLGRGSGKPKGVADAPFKNTWDEFVQKRLLRYAADNGYDGIAWSTGTQQAKRWSQSITEGVDTIQYNQPKVDESMPVLNMPGYLTAYKDGERVLSRQVEPGQLSDIVGKDIARKLLDESDDTFTIRPVGKNESTDAYTDRLGDIGNMDPVQLLKHMDKNPHSSTGYQVFDQNGNAWGYVYSSEKEAQKAIDDLATINQRMKTVSGANITIGGEGMRKFYDQQIPSNFAKLGKKFGLEIDEVPLNFGDQSATHGIQDIFSDGGIEENDDFMDLVDNFVVNGFNKNDFLRRSTNDLRAYLRDLDLDYVTKDDLKTFINSYTTNGNKAWDNYASEMGKSRNADLTIFNEDLFNNLREFGNVVDKPINHKAIQQGMWLSPDSRMKITQQSFPLYANQGDSAATDLTEGMSDRQKTALSNFLKWRESVVKQYRQMGIPINEMEQYVPFIPRRPLKKGEAETLRSVFGTNVQKLNMDNFDTGIAELSRLDPNLKTRTTNAKRPSEVNALLGKDWLSEDAAVAMNIRGTRAIRAQEFNTFAADFVSQYGIRPSELPQLTGGKVPDGYKVYEIRTDKQGVKTFREVQNLAKATEEGTETFLMPEDFVKMYGEYSDAMFNYNSSNAVVQLYDKINQLYKKTAYLWNPGHIVRDFQGNVFNNYLMGVKNPIDYVDGMKALTRAEGTIETVKGPVSYNDIYDYAAKHGIIDSVMAHEVPEITGRTEGAYTRAMRKATYSTDGWTRMSGFVHNLKEGQGFAQAATTTKKYLFDYFDLTPFERKTMKRIIPFYTWMRKNIPLQLETMLKNPRIYARLGKIQNAIAGGRIDWEDKPDYIQDSLAVQPEGSNNYIGLNMPYQDLTKIPIGFDTDALRNLISSISPVIRAPIESVTNQKWYTGDDIEKYAGEQTDIPILTKLLQALGVDNTPTIDARITGNMLDNIPILKRADNLLGVATGDTSTDSRKMSAMSTTIGGPALYSADSVETAAQYDEAERLSAILRALQDKGVEVPTTRELKSNKETRSQRMKRILGVG